MTNYTVRKVTGNYDISEEAKAFFFDCARKHSVNLGLKYNIETFSLETYLTIGHIWFCFKDEKPIGFMLGIIGPSSLDFKYSILKQDFLYALPGTRATTLLMKEFIDFGKRYANHIIITVGKYTNLKSRSLEKLGFNEWETSYKLEV